jgi:hypothetical protein
MRKFLPILVILVVGCGGAAGSAPAGTSSTTSSAPAPAGSTAPGAPSSEASAAPSEGPAASTTAALPADCAQGLGDYLVTIEPLVKGFDPAKATLADLLDADEAVQEKSVELLMANDARAPYSCSEVGLEWAYFDSRTPWDAVLAVAGDAAPGTVPYLTATRTMSAMDVDPVSAYGIEGCDAAVASIKKQVASLTKSGTSKVVEMGFDDAVKLLGLYKAYMRDVGNEVCPRDALGNDEFGFMGAAG